MTYSNEMTYPLRTAEDIAARGTILRGLVGSTVHGVTQDAHDDRDEMGVCIEPPEYVVGLAQFEQYEFRTQGVGSGVRSGPGDLDLCVYSLRKWAKLAAAGNPSIMLLLFTPELVTVNDAGYALRSRKDMFLSRSAGFRFLGYLESQRQQIAGQKKVHTNRPELIEQYGFDCYLDDTEFLTWRGWLSYDDVEDGDALATINQNTGRIEFQTPTDRVSKPYSGPILTSNTRHSNWAVTPNHRMRVAKMNRGGAGVNPRAYDESKAGAWGFRTAVNVTALDWYQQTSAFRRHDDYAVSDAHLALVGAYVSEGTVGKRRKDGSASVLRIEQKDGGRLHATMALAATEYGFRTYRYEKKRMVTIWTLANRAVARELAETCGEGSINKRLPGWTLSLSSRQADVLIQALLNGDGTPYKGDTWVYYTNSEELAGDVQALAVVAGRKSNVTGPYDGMFHVRIWGQGDGQFGSFRGRDVHTVEVEHRRIVCFTVPNETLVTRRHGKVAMHGNTKAAYHMVRMGLQGIELLTTGTIQLPIASPNREWLTDLRNGKYSKADALEQADGFAVTLRRLAEGGADLPDRVDMGLINRWLVDIYQSEWDRRGY